MIDPIYKYLNQILLKIIIGNNTLFNFYVLDVLLRISFSKKILIFYINKVTSNLSGTVSYKWMGNISNNTFKTN